MDHEEETLRSQDSKGETFLDHEEEILKRTTQEGSIAGALDLMEHLERQQGIK